MAAAPGGRPPASVNRADSMAIEALRNKEIVAIQFGTMSGAEVMRSAHLEICSRELYTLPARSPAENGCLDPRLGICNKNDVCGTCGKKLAECAGHFGYIKLELPVFHIGFLRHTIEILQNICKTCSRILLEGVEYKRHLRLMRAPDTDALKKLRIRRKITDACKKVVYCPYCSALNGQVKKVPGAPTFKIVHDRYKGSRLAGSRDLYIKLFQRLIPHASALEELNPLRVKRLFEAIPDCDLDLLWLDRHRGRPESLLLTHLFVPPVTIRPSIPLEAGGGSNEDDLTVKLQEIIHINGALRLGLSSGLANNIVMNNYEFLQNQVAAFLNGELPGLPLPQKLRRPIRGLAQRLKGKQGRFRGNLSGKRVDFSSRTVITPDPNLPIHCVGVPVDIARDLTYPERVTDLNIDRLKRFVLNGPDVHPGANYIRGGSSAASGASGFLRSLAYGDRSKAAAQLRIGDYVERHLVDDDIVLFNRQPSLHKMSIMCHRVVVLEGRTFRFNECDCAPYNADFDGDEMNLHVPQTEEARAEAALLMDVRDNMITPRSGEPLVAATQDFITAAYLLTRRDVFLTRDEFCQVAATLGDATEQVDLPPPAILRPVALWTGKQVVNLLLRPNRHVNVRATFELKARNYGKGGYLDPEDGYVVFRGGALMTGNLDKASLGGGSKRGLVYMLVRDNSPSVAARVLHRLTKMCTRWLTNWGFSIGIEDVSPSEKLSAKKRELISEGYTKCDRKIAEYRAGKLPLLPGCNEEQSLESVINGILSQLRDGIGSMCLQELPGSNAARVMATCGSKGSTLNICQMVACVGQQSVGGSRIPEGFVDRTLPIFQAKAKDPDAKGFVADSFYTGLSATEFFFHTMGGREGLVDTAVKTAETGYMQRRMMKALEDLSVQYDGTVRTSSSDIVQFAFGDDGLDPAYMEANGRPVDLQRALGNAGYEAPGAEPSLSPREIRLAVSAALAGPQFQKLLQGDDYGGQRFAREVGAFFDGDVIDPMARRWEALQQGCVTSSKPRKPGAPPPADWLAFPADLLSLDREAARAWSEKARVQDGFERAQEAAVVMHHTLRLSRPALLQTLESALSKYRRARIQPGEAVGAVAAHSMGEPATQMTLKTFHFAGVASMNVTLGIPRIKEIMNASRLISTPIIEASLENDTSEIAARVVKARLEKTVLGDIALCIREVYDARRACIEVVLDLDAIRALRLDDVTADSVAGAIVRTAKLRLTPKEVVAVGRDTIVVLPTEKKAASRLRAERYRRRELEREEQARPRADAHADEGEAGSKRAAAAAEEDELSTLQDMGSAVGGAAEEEDNDSEDEIILPGGLRVAAGGGAGSSTTAGAASVKPKPGSYAAAKAENEDADIYFGIQALKSSLPQVIIMGIPSVNRAVITKSDKLHPVHGVPTYKLLVEGYDLLRVMGIPGVKAAKTQSNHIIETEQTLGVEAARVMIMSELAKTYGSYGISIDPRHLQLLADLMTYRGEVLGITRFGIAKMKNSVLMLASFEKTPDHLFEAAVHARTDLLKGISESIIVGAPIPVGTGLFRLLKEARAPPSQDHAAGALHKHLAGATELIDL